MGQGHIPVEIQSDYGISASTNVSKLSVARLIKKVLMGNYKIFFLFFHSISFRGSSLD